MERKTISSTTILQSLHLNEIQSGSQALFHHPAQAQELIQGKYRLKTKQDLIKLFSSPIIKPN
jgi:hypothetical protein